MRTGLQHPVRIRGLGSEKVTPFKKSGVSEIFESGSAFDISLMIEVIVDGGVDRDEFLRTSYLSKPEHGARSSPKWQVRVFGSVVCPPRSFLTLLVSIHFHRSAI